MSQRIKAYHRWLVHRAKSAWKEAEIIHEDVCNDMHKPIQEVDCARRRASMAYEVYCFVELANPENYAAHKRHKKTRKEQGL